MTDTLLAFLTFAFNQRALLLALALILDSILGDPPWLWRRVPHPVVLFGTAIALADKHLNPPALTTTVNKPRHAKTHRVLGICVIVFLLTIAYLGGEAIILAAAIFANATNFPLVPLALEFMLVTILLAGGSLATHVRPVAIALKNRDLPQARHAISHIVGRDPQKLDAPAISRAAIETTAENMSDGIIAPSLFYLIGGIPAMCAYKMLNTADSMLGHRTARHRAFGWGAARLDDLANLIPARLTALLIILAALPSFPSMWRGIHTTLRDSHHHASPNAGWAEAAMAGVLNLRLAGPRIYGSHKTSDPPLNPKGRIASAKDIHAGLRVMWRGVAILVVALIIIAVI